MTTETKSTCQVCGRHIKSKNGIIAHHGYKRPGEGWQTASCYGARHVPYEVGHDALDLAIVSVASHIATAEKRHTELCFGENMPATLAKRIGMYRRDNRTADYTMPVGFDPTPATKSYYDRPYTYNSPEAEYATSFDNLLGSLRRDIDASRATLHYLTERRAAWVAPTPAKE